MLICANMSLSKIDFILVGAPRCATTWLYKTLEVHPEICVSRKKEYSPFDTHGVLLNKDITKQLEHCSASSVKGIFPVALSQQKDSELFLKKYYPNIKILFIIRNPVERAYSHYQYLNANGGVDAKLDFNIAMKDVHKYVDILKYGLYADAIIKYQKVFGKERVLVVHYEDVQVNPNGVIKQVCDFLDIAGLELKPAYSYFNARHEKFYRSKALLVFKRYLLSLNKVLKKKRCGRIGIFFMKKIGGVYLLNMLSRINGISKYSFNGEKNRCKDYGLGINDDTRKILNEFYKEDIERTLKILNR